jgi:hypothetical protein
MKGEKGVCSIGVGPNQVRRTKFDSKKHAQDSCDFHVSMGFIHNDAIVYNCKECGMFHFGKPEWAKEFSK